MFEFFRTSAYVSKKYCKSQNNNKTHAWLVVMSVSCSSQRRKKNREIIMSEHRSRSRSRVNRGGGSGGGQVLVSNIPGDKSYRDVRQFLSNQMVIFQDISRRFVFSRCFNGKLKKVHEKWNVGIFISLKYPFMFG